VIQLPNTALVLPSSRLISLDMRGFLYAAVGTLFLLRLCWSIARPLIRREAAAAADSRRGWAEAELAELRAAVDSLTRQPELLHGPQYRGGFECGGSKSR